LGGGRRCPRTWLPPEKVVPLVKRILILDDDPDICSLLKVALTRDGYAVDYAYHGDEAWRTLHTKGADLLLLDVGLPGANGWEFARRLREDARVAGLPIIVVTAHTGLLSRAASRVYHVADFIPKPFATATVRAAVKTVIGPSGATKRV